MAMKCVNCGKGIMVGHNVSHAKNRTRKVFKPNLHSARIIIDGTSMRVKLCTKCLRTVKGKDTRQVKNQKLEVKSQSENLKNLETSSVTSVTV
jgi:large subunit ribosomal protein L28